MSINKHKTVSKIASVLVSITTVGWLSGAAMLAPVAVHAQTDTAALIATLQAQIVALQAQLSALAGGSTASTGAKCSFTRSLTVGARGDDVTCLQNYLTGTSHYSYSGGATGYFGNVTKNAVAAWQAANGVSPAVGYFGSLSQAKYNSMVASAPSTPTTPTTPGTPASTPATSGTLKVESGMQPNASLFPVNATRVPFTVVKLTAPADSEVTVNSITVERTGLASDTAFAGIVLLDEQGQQLGIAKTLNSVHQAILTEGFKVSAGTTRTMVIAGNAQTSSNSLGGQIAYLSVVSVNSTAASVMGSLPISGAGHTVNETLTIGSVTLIRGPSDPGSSVSKEVGTTNYTFSAVRVTAGSAEKVYLRSVRWNQTGSVSKDDLANIKTYVEGVAYDTTVSSDGKYFTSTFGDNNGKGILIDKGFSKEFYVKGDITGGSGRNVDFDIAKRTDINLIGENYGYGITSPQTGSSDPTDDTAAFSSTEDPWYDAAQVTVTTGTLTVANSNTVPSQNIAINLNDQPLGAVLVTVKGEPISVGRIGWNISFDDLDSGEDVDDITNITLVDSSGKVVAGPVDGAAADSSNTTGSGHGSVVFSSTVTFPIGENVYILKGKVGTDIDNNSTINASTTPSADWATVTGGVSGNTVTPSPTSAVTLNTMTVKTGALAISVSSVPIAQTVIAGANQFLFANYILDATASGEDIRVTSLPVDYSGESTPTHLTACTMYDGSTAVNDPKDPSANASSTSFTFKGTGITVPKGTAKTLALKCNVSSAATKFFFWGLDATLDDTSTTYTGATGLTSGQTITETVTGSSGQKMTSSTGGTLVVSEDVGTPAYAIVSPGQEVELARYRFEATNEDIDVKRIAMELTNDLSNESFASSSPDALVDRKVTLWTTTGTQIGEAQFAATAGVGNTYYATSSLIATSAFKVGRDNYKVMVVKGVIAGITTAGPRTASGDLIKVDWDANALGLANGTYGTGLASGSNITPSGTESTVDGVRVMKAYPTISRTGITQPTVLTNGDLPLLRWSVKANNGDVALAQFTLRVATTSTSVTELNVFAFTDSGFSTPVSGISSGGKLMYTNLFSTAAQQASYAYGPANSDLPIGVTNSAGTASTTLQIPSGSTYYFEARATLADTGTAGDSITTQLQGDSTSFSNQSNVTSQMGQAQVANTSVASTTVFTFVDNDFIWSPNSTTTVTSLLNLDFTNGYGVVGLPSTNLAPNTLQTAQ